MAKFSVSERFACKVLGQHRSTQRKKPQGRPDEEALTSDIIRLASRYGRYGYRRITAMLRSEAVSYTHLRAHETVLDLVCRLLLETKKNSIYAAIICLHPD